MEASQVDEPSAGPTIGRTSLATFRTKLALDRTTLAWIRTALAMASFGFGLVAFFRTLQERMPSKDTAHLHQGAIIFGVALILLGLTATILASFSHWRSLYQLRLGQAPVLRRGALCIILALLLGILCLVGLAELFLL
jgi:putative membrane protein